MMPIWYRELEPEQEPFDEATDSLHRAVYSFNVQAVKAPSVTFLEELTSLLVENQLGVPNETIFLTSSVSIPDGDGPYLTIVETGGTARERIQNDVRGWQRPSAKLSVHARTSYEARALAYAARDACQVRNRNVTPVTL
jgi:hypothetical protein